MKKENLFIDSYFLSEISSVTFLKNDDAIILTGREDSTNISDKFWTYQTFKNFSSISDDSSRLSSINSLTV